MTLTLTCLRGYPGSGKSTRARELANETGAVVISRDDLRMMLHGTYFSGQNELEEEVTIAERAQVKAFLKAGKSVIVDATHLNGPYLRKWSKLAGLHGAEFIREDIITPVEECRRRDHARMLAGGRYVGDQVIERMVKKFPVANWPNVQAPPKAVIEPVAWDESLQPAIIVDIDGTVAQMAGRSPYDYSQVHTDTVDERIKWLVNRMDDAGVWVLFVSGRDDSCREATQKWLSDNGIWYDQLHMRPTGAKDENGNKLPDYIVKLDLFNQNIRGKYNVQFVLDDRDQVVDLWRRLGLKCLQVQEGDF